MLYSLFLALAAGSPAEPESVARFTFHDAAIHDGRTVLAFRPVQFGPNPVRPLTFAIPPGAGARHGLIPFGPGRDDALAVVWEPDAAGGPRLWLDADNDGRLTANECHALKGKEIAITADLLLPLNEGASRPRRTLIFRRSALTGGLSYAVRGYFLGALNLGGKTYRAMLTDGDADGCFHGAGADRLWIDLDGDGRLDALTEQFLLGSPVTVAGRVYVVKSDPTASEVRVYRRATDHGTARLMLTDKPGRRVGGLEIQIVSDIGEIVTVRDLSRPSALPVGKYRLASLHVQMTDARGRVWDYHFAGDGGYALVVHPGKEAALTLLADFALKVNVSPTGNIGPGQSLSVTPTLENSLGLFLANCTVREADADQPQDCAADIRLVSPAGKAVDRAASGFH
jgi:hypothetical protein